MIRLRVRTAVAGIFHGNRVYQQYSYRKMTRSRPMRNEPNLQKRRVSAIHIRP